ncbi:PAAR domain-containing protein [Pseudomonas sp. L13]|uniref:PAAR domain-containing protein n=1 Tax=Pseudomonas sp. L13 TaxID=343985 RepID=UPI0015B5A93D|nr:PAAR domain-containing protein [Pseudomonas sp. L13]
MKDTDTEIQPSTRPIKAIYDYATLGSRTRMGGEIITASTSLEIHDLRIACVGDRVRYPDGKESEIVSGAGFAATYKGLPIAIVGSTTDNGDTVTSSLQNLAQVVEYADGEGIPGLLKAGYRVESQM